jgi:hypothetical protein
MNSNHLHIAVLIDALGWEVAGHFKFCRGILDHSSPLGTVLGYSSAAIPSLVSGELPVRHGAWAMYQLAGAEAPFKWLRHLPPLPHPIERRLRVLVRRLVDSRQSISGYYDLYDIPLHYLHNFDVACKTDPYQPGALPVPTIFDDLVAQKVPHRIWTYRTPEADNMRQLLSAVDGTDRFLFFYSAELDALMHIKGIFHPEIGRKLEVYEQFIGEILERANKMGKTVSVSLFSDHGMTEVTQVVDLWAELKRQGFRLGPKLRAFFDATMARFWCEPETAAGIGSCLESRGWGRMLSREELERYGCYFENGRYGTGVFLLSPGLMIVPSFMGKRPLAAMHGYDPADRFSRGCFFTNRPGPSPPASILDIKSFLIGRLGEGGS